MDLHPYFRLDAYESCILYYSKVTAAPPHAKSTI